MSPAAAGSKAGSKQKLQFGDAGAVRWATLPPAWRISICVLSPPDQAVRLRSAQRVVSQIGRIVPTDPAISYLPATLLADRGFRSVQIEPQDNVTFAEGAAISQIPVNIDLGTDFVSGAFRNEAGGYRTDSRARPAGAPGA